MRLPTTPKMRAVLDADPNLPTAWVVWPRLVQLPAATIPRDDHQAILP